MKFRMLQECVLGEFSCLEIQAESLRKLPFQLRQAAVSSGFYKCFPIRILTPGNVSVSELGCSHVK